MNLEQTDWFLKQTEDEQKREREAWSSAVKTEADVELRAEKFRLEVDARKKQLFPSNKWVVFFDAFKALFK